VTFTNASDGAQIHSSGGSEDGVGADENRFGEPADNFASLMKALLPLVIQREVHSKYKFVDVLGEGAYGKVFLATARLKGEAQGKKTSKEQRKLSKSSAQTKVAIKVLDKNKIHSNDTRLRQMIAEIKVHWALTKCDAVL